VVDEAIMEESEVEVINEKVGMTVVVKEEAKVMDVVGVESNVEVINDVVETEDGVVSESILVELYEVFVNKSFVEVGNEVILVSSEATAEAVVVETGEETGESIMLDEEPQVGNEFDGIDSYVEFINNEVVLPSEFMTVLEVVVV
jgi:hypothetical protein